MSTSQSATAVAATPHADLTSHAQAESPRAKDRLTHLRRRFAVSGLLGGSALLFFSTTIVNLGNYLFNLILGRWLGPAAFSDLSLIVTLMLILTLITATLQTVAAKFAATYDADGQVDDVSGLRRWAQRWAWGAGAIIAAGFIAGASFWQDFFNAGSSWPFVILGVGIPIYFAQGVDRGILQGRLRFGRLALSYQAEMWARLIVGIIAVAIGWSVSGAVGALTLSFVATWLVARTVAKDLPNDADFDQSARHAVAIYAIPVAMALVGQILINNSDVLIVKRFFSAEVAGHYAALALIGRIVFFATWSIVTVLLPTVAQRNASGQPHWHLLWISAGIVAAVSVGVVVTCAIWSEQIVTILFGAAYTSIAPLLWLYAIATSLFALANVFIVYRLSVGQSVSSFIAVVAGSAQVVLLVLFHSSLTQVVLLQIGLMGILVLVLVGVELVLRQRETDSMARSV